MIALKTETAAGNYSGWHYRQQQLEEMIRESYKRQGKLQEMIQESYKR
jgi:hypothetical protein